MSRHPDNDCLQDCLSASFCFGISLSCNLKDVQECCLKTELVWIYMFVHNWLQAVAFVNFYCFEGTADKAGNVPYFLDGNFSCFGVGSKVSYIRIAAVNHLTSGSCFACLLAVLNCTHRAVVPP